MFSIIVGKIDWIREKKKEKAKILMKDLRKVGKNIIFKISFGCYTKELYKK